MRHQPRYKTTPDSLVFGTDPGMSDIKSRCQRLSALVQLNGAHRMALPWFQCPKDSNEKNMILYRFESKIETIGTGRLILLTPSNMLLIFSLLLCNCLEDMSRLSRKISTTK
jgi:hypothetical protein